MIQTMDANTPMMEVLRAWRKTGARGRKDADAEQAFDEANQLGLTDRTMLIASTRIALNIANDYARTVDLTLDAMLEAMLREFVEQGE